MAPAFIASTARLYDAERRHHDHRAPASSAGGISARNSSPSMFGQLQIGEDQVGAIHKRSASSAVAGLVHIEAPPRQVAARSRGAAFLRLPLPECCFFMRAVCDDAGSGRHVKHAPFTRLALHVILPPCSSTILATIASPSPMPSGLVVKNGLKIGLHAVRRRCPRRGRSPRSRLGSACGARLHRHRAARRRRLHGIQDQVVENALHQFGIERKRWISGRQLLIDRTRCLAAALPPCARSRSTSTVLQIARARAAVPAAARNCRKRVTSELVRSTSLAMKPGHLPRDFVLPLKLRCSISADALMVPSGLRNSCASPAESWPSAARRSRPAYLPLGFPQAAVGFGELLG